MSGEEDDVPFYLMPIAAVFGMYTVWGILRMIYLIYANLTTKEDDIAPPPSLKSRGFGILVVSVIGSIFMYARIVASVEVALETSAHALFDPYEILNVAETSNTTVVKQAYRELSKTAHPDKGGDPDMFHRVHLAYKALVDETGRANYQQYGHPDGPVTSRALSFALPDWLLHPEGTTAVVLILLYLGMFASLIFVVIAWATATQKEAEEQATKQSVAGADAAYLASKLSPSSTPMDVLFCIATTPENIVMSQNVIDKMEQVKAEKMAQVKAEQEKKTKNQQKKGATIQFDDLDQDGWAEEDDDDDDEDAKAAAKKAKEAEEAVAKEKAQRIAQATGQKKDILLEGIDDGVIGQAWVERTLASKGKWPPPNMDILEGVTFAQGGDEVEAMDHVAVRRNLCMTMGRVNAQMLNTHPELVEAGSKGLIDQTYFKSTQEFRQRSGVLLEAALRLALSLRSYRLAKTIVETVAMFKIGTSSPDDKETLEWFTNAMKRQYGGDKGVPRLDLKNYSVSTPGEDEIATGDVCAVQLDMERVHAENFTKQKVAICTKQGIPPQVALQTYREGWWILLRAKKLDGDDDNEEVPEMKDEDESKNDAMSKLLGEGVKEKFNEETGENRLLTAWPMIVQNVAQKSGKVKIQFKAPDTPGKYRFYVAIKSQEFLGADQEFTLEADIVDAADVERKEEEEGDDKDDDDKKDEDEKDSETKKDK